LLPPSPRQLCACLTHGRRCVAAAAVRAEASLAQALRSRLGRTLSKAHLLELCRVWGYRSSCWVRKGDFCRRRAAGEQKQRSAPQALLEHPPTLLPVLDGCALSSLVESISAHLTRSAFMIEA